MPKKRSRKGRRGHKSGYGELMQKSKGGQQPDTFGWAGQLGGKRRGAKARTTNYGGMRLRRRSFGKSPGLRP